MARKTLDLTPALSANKGIDFTRTTARSFNALFDAADDEVFVLANCGFDIYSAHPSDSTLRVVGIEVKLKAANTSNPADNSISNLWGVDLQYGPWNPLENPPDGNPLNLPLRFRIDFYAEEVPAFEDVDGNPIVNAAGDPYDPPLTRKITRATLTVRRNESLLTIDLNALQALSNALNLYTWNNFAPKTARLNPVKLPDIQYSQATNQFFLPMEYVFDINNDTWVKQVLNAGFRQLDSSGNLIPILINGQPATVPVPLDEAGHAILTPEYLVSTGDVPDDTDPGGYSGEPAGGGEAPSGGTGVSAGSNFIIDAYDVDRTADFTSLRMDTIFTLPVL